MARPVYPYEMGDPDFAWLLETFKENNPGYCTIQETCLPVVLIADKWSHDSNTDEAHGFVKDDPFDKLLHPSSEGEELLDENS